MKTSAEIQRKRKGWNALLWTIIILAIACMIGFLVCIFMIGWSKGDPVLVGILAGAFFIGACVLGLLGMLIFRRTDRLALEELDALEREDDLNSFFVGEGTLATFGDEKLRIHGREDGKKDVVVPYYDLKFYSVCARRNPKERGSWSVVIEIPARYFNNNASRTMTPILIQTDGKERLYSRMKELNLELIGEPYNAEQSDKKFVQTTKFKLAHTVKYRKALILIGVAALFLVGGVFATVYWNSTPGSIIIVLGAYFAIRSFVMLARSKAVLGIYEEGIFYREPDGVNNVFLKWEEFSSLCIFEQEGRRSLRLQCPYGAYDLPYFEGAYEYLKEHYPDKCGENS